MYNILHAVDVFVRDHPFKSLMKAFTQHPTPILFFIFTQMLLLTILMQSRPPLLRPISITIFTHSTGIIITITRTAITCIDLLHQEQEQEQEQEEDEEPILQP